MKIIKTLISVAALVATTGAVFAAGTQAGTPVNNTATIDYAVGGVNQTDIESSEAGNSTPGPGNGSATSFLVDKKVDLLVTAGAGVNVVPNATGASTSITFTVLNEGNSDETFTLSTTGTVVGDDFDTSTCTITSPASPIAIAQDIAQAVTVQCTIPDVDPGNVENGKTSLVDLLASANVAAETTGSETAGTEDIVYADDAGTATDAPNGAVSGDATRNAKHSATNTYTIDTADLSVQKTSAVTSDPFNGVTNPKRIPGATVEYTITISNADGAADADSLVITDILQSDLTFVSCSTSGDATPAATCSNTLGTVTTNAFTLPGGSGSASTETLTIIATVN